MNNKKIAVIAGTGFDENKINSNKKTVQTEYGAIDVFISDNMIFLPRHGEGHSVPPHKINYRGNIKALQLLDVEKVIGIYAVGSITDKVKPLDWGFANQFMDFSGRNITFYDDEVVHTSMSEPFSKELTEYYYQKTKEKFNKEVPKDIVYVNTNGPRLETPSEINAYKIMGGDVVGMTAGTEATLCKEVGISLTGVVYSINWAAGIEDDISFVDKDKREKIKSEIKKLLAIENLV